MDLTPSERRLVNQLRNLERTWETRKWFMLGMVAMIVLAAVYTCFPVGRMLSSHDFSPINMVIVTMAIPLILLGLGIAALTLGWIVRDWHGNAIRVLLLKLIELQQPANDGLTK